MAKGGLVGFEVAIFTTHGVGAIELARTLGALAGGE